MFAEQPEPIRPMAIRRQVQKFTIKLFANIWIAREVSGAGIVRSNNAPIEPPPPPRLGQNTAVIDW